MTLTPLNEQVIVITCSLSPSSRIGPPAAGKITRYTKRAMACTNEAHMRAGFAQQLLRQGVQASNTDIGCRGWSGAGSRDIGNAPTFTETTFDRVTTEYQTRSSLLLPGRMQEKPIIVYQKNGDIIMEQQPGIYTSDETGIDGNLGGMGGNGDESGTNGQVDTDKLDGGDNVDADESGASAGGGG